ncbi:CATRA conflict system CASPASE/TPR repeat-associated protein [Streptomyces sp. NPDC050636]|uniref:CATRA conflict system CASPASE/TPR repeat-associated protein n=1 Tax=Streptomyces sp. NPDC050636 TaxID=3154510 RepID=UPI0034247581
MHLFVRADRFRTGGPAADHLRRMWRGCAELGMREPMPVPDAPPLELPDELPAPGDGDTGDAVVAARTVPANSPALAQAMIHRLHDTLVLTAALEAHGDDNWADLSRRWDSVIGAPPPSEVLGEVRLFRALLPGTDTTPVRNAARAVGDPVRWGRPMTVVGDTFRVWDATPCRDAPVRSVIAVAVHDSPDAADRAEEMLDFWCWARGPLEPAPFTRVLLHAAKLRHQMGVLARERAALGVARADVEASIRRLTALHSRITGNPGARSDARRLQALVAAETEHSRLQTQTLQSNGLIATLGNVRRMRRSVDVIASNLALSAAHPLPRDTPGGLFDEYRTTADWLRRELDDEALQLENVRQRADEVARVTGTVTQQLLQRHQQQLTVIQSSSLGGLIMALAAVQGLGYRVPLPGPLQAPVIALLATLALFLPGAVLRWSRGTSRDAPLPAFDLTGAALVGAAGGWLITTASWLAATGRSPWPGWSLLAAGALAALSLLAGRSMMRRHRRGAGRR